MVLNQGQRLTAASDWEPYQAKHRIPNYRKRNIDCPPQLTPWPYYNKRQNKGTKVRTWHYHCILKHVISLRQAFSKWVLHNSGGTAGGQWPDLTDVLPWEGFWQFVQKFFVCANPQFHQMSQMSQVSDNPAGEEARCGHPRLVWFDWSAVARPVWTYCQNLKNNIVGQLLVEK